ncbi:MAG: VRR-NUC domain-containing protein [Sphingomonas sp.]|jgi:hypothetical protein
MKSTEKDTQKAIIQYLEAKKIFHWRNNTGGTMVAGNHFMKFGYPGSPDIIAVVKGQFIGIEVKDIKGKLNDNQEIFKEKLEKAGGLYIIAKSIDDIMKIL